MVEENGLFCSKVGVHMPIKWFLASIDVEKFRTTSFRVVFRTSRPNSEIEKHLSRLQRCE